MYKPHCVKKKLHQVTMDLFFFIVKFPNSSLQICANGAFSCAESVRVASTNKQVTNLINICRGIVESVQGTSAERKVLPKQLKDCRKKKLPLDSNKAKPTGKSEDVFLLDDQMFSISY